MGSYSRRRRKTLYKGDIQWWLMKKPHHVYIWANTNWFWPTSFSITIDQRMTWSTRGGLKSIKAGPGVYHDSR